MSKTLEQRIEKLEFDLAVTTKTLQDFAIKGMEHGRGIAKIFDDLERGKKIDQLHLRRFSNISRDLEKLFDVYYHIFPERLKQDVEISEQMDRIQGKPGSADKTEE